MTSLPRPLPSYIDHTLLRPEATEGAVRQVVEEAALHGFAAVVVPPVHVPLAAGILAGTGVHVGTVAAFPLGYSRPEVRREESRRAVADGAVEIDTVMNLSWLKGGEDARVAADLGAWVEALRAERDGLVLKVILETALLSDAEKLRGAGLAAAAGADFVKTSTGFGPGARRSRTWRSSAAPSPPAAAGSASRRRVASATPRPPSRSSPPARAASAPRAGSPSSRGCPRSGPWNLD
jgi:deoxyribose-phosphate aldolase